MTDAPGTGDQNILVIRLGALGDVANTIPAVSALRKGLPEARIIWLAEEPSNELIEAARVADEIILFPRKKLSSLWSNPLNWGKALRETRRFFKELHKKRYVCSLDFQGNFKSGVLGAFSYAKDRIGYARGFSREMNWMFNRFLAAPTSRRLPRAEKNAALAQVVLPELELHDVDIPRNDSAAVVVDDFLKGVPGNGPLVVLHPGVSAFGAFKRWPAERFGLLAQRLKEKIGARCVITRGPGEEGVAYKAWDGSKESAVIAPVWKIPELIELLRKADAVVACDTGPLHIAALLRRPVVAIFGPKDPAIYAPYGTRSELVRIDMPCGPCNKRRCSHASCMMGIEVDDVAKSALKLLDR